MEDNGGTVELLLEKVEAYGKTSCELIKLKAVDKTAGVLSMLVSYVAVISMLFMFLVVVNIGLALWLGDLLGKTYYGFFCVAGFYGLLGVILYLVKDTWIKKQVSNAIIRQVLN